ncbi:hypothetical protein [Nocardia yamanashiensis]|uniref:hypothetical protein n=1 Tax=Nocardia yamanashiensis TaxID=209247 RepID=UPI000833898A|nr:hypothetical protein [Nocardia yamanashiensis]
MTEPEQSPDSGSAQSPWARPGAEPEYAIQIGPPAYAEVPSTGKAAGARFSKRKVALILGAVGALVVAAGTAVVAGTWSSDRTTTAAGTSGSRVAGGFDEPASIDPCSFVEPSMFTGIAERDSGGDFAIGIEPDSFSGCTVKLGLPGGARSAVTAKFDIARFPAEFLSRNTDIPMVQRGPVQVAAVELGGSGKCVQLIMRADGVGVTLEVTSKAQDSAETLCRVRDVITDAAVAAFTGNTAKRLVYPSDSVGGRDLCGMLNDAELRASTGAATARAASDSIAYHCRWEADGSRIDLHATLMPRSMPGAKGDTETIAGRRTIVDDDHAGRCQLTLTGRTWDPWLGAHYEYKADGDTSRFTEQITMTVYQGVGACDTAKALAATAWPKLPHS